MPDYEIRDKIPARGSLLVKTGGGEVKYIGGNSEDVNQVVTYNKDFQDIEATDLSELAPVPPGGIILWSGSIKTIPKNFFLCNGQVANGRKTPNLLGKFIVGAEAETGNASFDPVSGEKNGEYGVNAEGGETAHQLTIPELPAHTHTQGAVSGGGSGGGGAVPAETGSTGNNEFHENRPPYYALAYIMFSPRKNYLTPE